MEKIEEKKLRAEADHIRARLAGLHEMKFGGASGIRTDVAGADTEDSLRGRLKEILDLLVVVAVD